MLVLIAFTMTQQNVQMRYDPKEDNKEHFLNYLLFMYGVKHCAKSKEQIDSLAQTIFLVPVTLVWSLGSPNVIDILSREENQ